MTVSNNEAPLVLIVDDQPADIKLLEVFLGAAKYRTISASDGGAALEQAAARHPDLILLDVMMPRVDGFEVCRQLKADPELRHIPIIFLSAKDRVQDKVAGLELGAHDYLTKPFRLEELNARVRRVLSEQQQRVAALEEAEQYRANLLAVFQHELRNPLAIIRSFTDLLSGQLKNLPPERQLEYLRHIATGYESLTLFADNLAALDQLERGEPLSRSRQDLTELARQQIATAEPGFAAKEQHLSADIPAGPLDVQAEPKLVRLAMGALLSNANRYTPEGGEVRVALARHGDEVAFVVTDDGPGMTEAQLATLFDRFDRLAQLDPGKPGGVGLGLAVARRVADFHGGRLDATSAPGQGSEFTLTLPAA